MTNAGHSLASSGGAPFSVRVERTSDGVLVVHLQGELDMASAPHLVETLRRAGGTPPFHIVVDLSQLTFIDSSGLNALVSSGRAVNDAGGSIIFAQPSAHVARLLEIVCLPETVRFDESLEQAVRIASRS